MTDRHHYRLHFPLKAVSDHKIPVVELSKYEVSVKAGGWWKSRAAYCHCHSLLLVKRRLVDPTRILGVYRRSAAGWLSIPGPVDNPAPQLRTIEPCCNREVVHVG